MKSSPLVSIMILGWNNYGDVINCLKSLGGINYANYNVVLVDNGSKPENFDRFIAWLDRSKSKYIIAEDDMSKSKQLKTSSGLIFIIKNEKNLGFTGGSNIGLRYTWKICKPKYLLLLNGDTKVTQDFLGNLVRVCEKDKKIGSAQSVLVRFDKKTIDSLGIEMVGYRIFDSHGGEAISAMSGIKRYEEIFACCGASALYRVDLIKRIGLFDEDLFATCEDFDLAWRIRLENYKCILAKDSVVYHRGGISRFKKDHITFDMKSYYMAKNTLVMFNRYYPINFKIITTCIVRIGVALISAVKNHRLGELLKIFYNFRKERRAVAKNGRLKKIQREWIR